MNKLGTKLGAIAMSAVMAVSFAPSAVITTLAAGSDSTPLDAGEKSIPVYSVFNPGTGEHLFTTFPAEVAMLETLNWIGETPERWYAPTTGDTVYRLARADGGDHFYTANAEEKDILVKDYGWTVDKNSFCTAASDDEKATYVYRLFKNGDGHHYTISFEEASILVQNYGWTLEVGDGFYGYAEDQDSPVADELKVTLSDPTPKVGDILTAEVTGGKKPYTYQWLADGTAIPDADGATLAITEDMVGKKISVKVTDADSNTKTSDESAAVSYVYPELVSAVQKAANSFTVTFDADASEIIGVDDIEVISEDLTDVKKITGLDWSEDGTSAVVTVNTSFKDGVEYNINCGNDSAFFVASVGEVASIYIKTSQAEINTKTPIEFSLLDDEGIDVTSAVKVDDTCIVTFTGDYSNYENTRASASTVTMATAGDVCTVKVTYDKNDGVTERVESSKDITCVAATEKMGTPYFKAVTPKDSELNNTSGCFRFYDPKNSADTAVSVAINKTKEVHFYVQDTDKSAISYDSYEIESADETIANAEIDVATGKWASFKVTGNQKGNVLLVITATKNGASTKYEVPVVVTTQAVPYKVAVGLSKSTMSNAWDLNYYGEVSMKVLDSKGEEADPDTYTVQDFELITKNVGIDDDLKGDAYYEAALAADAAGFQLGATDKTKMKAKYWANVAKGGSYVIEGSVTNLTNGDVIAARNTVTVQELNKDAWILAGATDEDMYQLQFNDGDTDGLDDITGLTEEETWGYPLITETEYNKLLPLTVLKDGIINPADDSNKTASNPSATLNATYAGYNTEATATLAQNKKTLAYVDADGNAVIIDDDADLLHVLQAATAGDNKADREKVTLLTAGETLTVTAATATSAAMIAKADLTNKKYTTKPMSDSDLFTVTPKYAGRLTVGQDAYQNPADGKPVKVAENITSQKGVDTTYSVEMVQTMGFASDNAKTAKLVAKMGGLFAGYVDSDGAIGVGRVLPSITTRIVNLQRNPSSGTVNKKTENYWGLGIETYFGKNIATQDVADLDEDGNFEAVTLLYDVNDGHESTATIAPGAGEPVETTFLTVTAAPDDGKYDFYTKETDEIKAKADDDFARVGQYKVVFSFWYAKSTKPVEEAMTFSVKNDLYVPTVTVKSQTIESYTQAGWKEAVVSEVDLNNNDPYTYSVIDLEDKTGVTINDAKTPAKWAEVIEEGVNFHVPLDRTFKLS